MTTPYPVLAPAVAARYQRGWLRVVNKEQIPVQLQVFRILLRGSCVNLKVVPGYFFLPAMKGVMKFLGDFKKLFFGMNHVPAGINAQLSHQRQYAVKYLCDTTPAKGGVYIMDNLAFEPFSDQLKLFDDSTAYYRLVIGEFYLMFFSIICISDVLNPSSVKLYGSTRRISSASSGSSR